MIKDEKMNPLFLEKSNFLVADGDGEVLGAGQIRPLGSFFELASLVVREDARGQGIGSALVNELLELHRAKGWEGDPPSVLLLTIKSAVGFYTRLGFAEYPIGMAPVPMQMEAGAGSVLAKMATGESLVCMRFKYPSIELSCDGCVTHPAPCQRLAPLSPLTDGGLSSPTACRRTGTMLKSFKKGT
jgi:N-acetylglutamate synthase-like GNAT family acetyltransferase